MDMVAQMMLKVNTVFNNEYLDKLALKTGFIKRKRKIHARIFLENLMFLRLEHPHSSLEDLVYEFHKNNTQLTKQALHKKFNSSAVDFVHKVLKKLLERTFTEQHFLTKIPFINEVQLIDSSEIKLGAVDNSSSEALRPATCSRDPEILLNAQHYCTEIDRSGSREQVAGRRHLNCQQTLMSIFMIIQINLICAHF